MSEKRSRIAQDQKSRPAPPQQVVEFTPDDLIDLVAFHVKCDAAANGSSHIDKNVSQKKCPFCD